MGRISVSALGFLGLSASAAILVGLYRHREQLQRQINSKEAEIEVIAKELALIQKTRSELKALRDEHITMVNDNVAMLDAFWQAVIADAEYLLEYLESSGNVEIPEYHNDYMNEGVRVYTAMAAHIKDYARGISSVLSVPLENPVPE